MTPDFILFIPTMSLPMKIGVAETEYGVSIAAVIGRDNLWATQFHPEKKRRTRNPNTQKFCRQLNLGKSYSPQGAFPKALCFW